MRFKQMRELLEYVVECRMAMSKLYERLNNQADSSRVKLLLDYLKNHQIEVADKVSEYIDDAPQGVLDTWFKRLDYDDIVAECTAVTLNAGVDEHDVMNLALELDNKVLALLHLALEQSEHQETRQALESVLQAERIRQQRFVHSTLRMDDI
ncbi:MULTISPECIES: hypothetical protein [Ferrimonas]|uniref:hypothetical protein n=1 Tax=Ferrimonas TaxID=44011 RepID=UPI0004036537|nr:MULTISPECIES: hypothetical protein [Ferrimonas]USD37100.1 hypothetical protein J8Z22_19235 [Ferrimonas sp. SCSIO 43195]